MTTVEDWATFATVSGGAAAGLTGLLFVAVSIRVDVIARSAELRSRAAQTLSLFVIALLVSIVLSIPGQAYGPLGAELIAHSLILAATLVVLDRRAALDTPTTAAHAVAHILEVAAPNTITSISLLASGVLVALGVHAGLYVLVVPVVAALAGGVVSAWLLLTKIPA